MSSAEPWVAIGRLKRVRGNRGELIAEIDSPQPGRAGRLRVVRLEKDSARREAIVERVWYHASRPILKFAGIDSISAAEEWQGADILVPPDEKVQPEKGEYSHADLIGCTVLRENGSQPIGVVRGIEEYGGAPLLNLETPAGGELLVPFARAICREIDTNRKVIRAWLPEGL
jgi:16S rRNA processing protein RimM